MQTAAFTITEIDTKGAAEVVGLDCSQPLDAGVQAELKAAFLNHPVLVFRDQHLAPQAQAAFSRCFGPLEEHTTSQFNHPDDPAVQILSNEIRPDGTPVGFVDAGDFWHSDSSFKSEPTLCTVLYSVKNPERGGDTAFCNLTQAYEALPTELSARLTGRTAQHHLSKLLNPRVTVSAVRPDATAHYTRVIDLPQMVQPVVRTHPETGRRSLYISPRFTLRIDGMDADESEALLLEAFAFMQHERFVYVHKWHDHDLLMWDNRCLNHLATGGYALPDTRRMHRSAVRGDRAVFVP